MRDSITGRETALPPAPLREGTRDLVLRFTLPETDSGMIDELGLRVESDSPAKAAITATLTMKRLRIFGKARYTLRPSCTRKELGSVLPFSHNHGAWELDGGQMTLLCEREAQAFTGNYFARDARVSGKITLHSGTQALVALRAQGARRGLYAGLYGEGQLAILRMDAGALTVLATADFAWQYDQPYDVRFEARGDQLALTVAGVRLTAAAKAPAYGMAGYGMFAMGRASFGDLTVEEL